MKVIDDLKMILRHASVNCITDAKTYTEQKARYNDVVAYVYALEQNELSTKWIPCSERLPEESGEYLVWYDCGYATENPSDDDEKGCMVVNFDAGVGDFGYWHDEYDSYTLGFLDSEFIYFETAVAWKPQPEPYKGE